MPSLLVTVCVEGDNLQTRPAIITTRNGEMLDRVQGLFQQYRIRPTWLTSYEMAVCPCFQEFGESVVQRQSGEIGAHLHGWTCPPHYMVSEDDCFYQPYGFEWPQNVLRDKINYLTDALEDAFQTPITTHRAGRWGIDSHYIKCLHDRGYRVDCSVTPFVSWRKVPGVPGGRGGSDYLNAPDQHYLMDLEDPLLPGNSSMMQVPVSVRPVHRNRIAHASVYALQRMSLNYVQRATRRLFPSVIWLRPNGRNLVSMMQLIDEAEVAQQDYVQLVLNSSDFLMSGNARFQTEREVHELYEDLEQLFERITRKFHSRTMSEFYDLHTQDVTSREPVFAS